MKRSVKVPLVLLGTAALAGCGEKVQSDVYVDADSCIAASKYDADQCVADYAAAVKEHDATTRAYVTLAECEQQYGVNQCAPITSAHTAGGGWFIPNPSGFLMSTRTKEGTLFPPRALYRKLDGEGLSDDAGRMIASRTGPVQVKVSQLREDSDNGSSGGSSGSGGGSSTGSGGGHSGSFFGSIARGGFGSHAFHISG